MPIDDLSFFDDPAESSSSAPPPATTETPAEPAAPATPAVSAEQFAAMQQRLESAERWRQDVGRMFLGQNGQPQPQQVDPQAVLQQFLTNPVEVLQNVQEQSVAQAQEAMRNQAIIDDRRAKHPELAKLEPLIDWNSAMQAAGQAFYQANQRQPSFAEALDTAIGNIKSGLQGIVPGAQPNTGGNRMVMNMDITGGQPANSRPLDLSTVSDADWPKVRAQIRSAQGI